MDSELSLEMLMEITSRASLQTLDIMRCMSKQLNTLTYESYLLDLYKKRNNIVSGFLVQNTKSEWMDITEFAPSPDSNCLDLGFLPSDARILATSEHGIMVFQTPHPDDFMKDVYHVCKPATKQVWTLPNNPEVKYTVRKVAVVVMALKPLHYKIIRFSDHPALKQRRKFYTTYGCDIFDSMTCEWRSLDHLKLCDGVFLTDSQPITKSGSIYMLLTNNNILKFDAYSEEWEVFSSPVSCDESCTSMELVKYGGRLGIACKSSNVINGCWEIWVLKMDGMWEKEGLVGEGENEMGTLKALYDSNTVVLVDRDTLMFYSFKQEGGDNMITKVVLKDIPCQVFSFRSDFETIDLI